MIVGLQTPRLRILDYRNQKMILLDGIGVIQLVLQEGRMVEPQATLKVILNASSGGTLSNYALVKSEGASLPETATIHGDDYG